MSTPLELVGRIEEAAAELRTLLAPPPPTFALVAEPPEVAEGGTLTFRLSTTGLEAGTAVRYTLQGVGAADVGVPLQGDLTIGPDGRAVLIVPIVADSLTEGVERITCMVGSEWAEASATIADTSVTPAPPPAPPPPPPPPTGDLVATGHDYKPLGDPNYTAWMADTLRSAAIPPLHRPWTVYADPARGLIARHARGVAPAGYTRMLPFGGSQGYAEYLTTLHEGKFLSFLPSASDVPDQAAGSLRAGWTEPRPGVRKPLFIRAGRRGEALGSPYITWHGHSPVREDGTVADGVHIPLFIGIDVIGRLWALLRDGSLAHLGDTPVTTWSNDFAYHHADRKVFHVADSGAGAVIRVDRKATPWASSVLASGLGHVTSLREVGGVLYAVSNPDGAVHEIDPATGAHRVLCTVPRAFWIDYDSQGRILVCTDTRRVYRIDRSTGLSLAQLISDAYTSKVIQPWITLECDRAGALGYRDALYIASVQGTAGSHVCLRVGADGESLGPWFGWPMGGGNNASGDHAQCGDPHGHYPWTAAILGQDGGDDAGLFTLGKAEANGALIVPRSPGWKPMSAEINSLTGKGRQVIYWGTSPGAADAKLVPSFTTQMNSRGGGLIDYEHLASMPLADAVAFVRGGMAGSYARPNITANDMRCLMLAAHAGSQQYLIEGAPYMDRVRAELNGMTV